MRAENLLHPRVGGARDVGRRRVAQQPVRHLHRQRLDQLLVGGVAEREAPTLEARLIELAQQHREVGLVAVEEQRVRLVAQRLVDLGAEGCLGGIVDNVAQRGGAALLQHLGDAMIAVYRERRLHRECEHPLRALREQELPGAAALQIGVGLGADDVAVMRQLGDRVRPRDGEQHRLALPAQRGHRGGDGGGPGAEDGADLVDVDQLARGAHAGVGIGLAILGDEGQLAAEHAAGRVDVVGRRPRDLDHRRAIGAARAGERGEGAETDRLILRRRGTGGGRQGERGEQRGAAGEHRSVPENTGIAPSLGSSRECVKRAERYQFWFAWHLR